MARQRALPGHREHHPGSRGLAGERADADRDYDVNQHDPPGDQAEGGLDHVWHADGREVPVGEAGRRDERADQQQRTADAGDRQRPDDEVGDSSSSHIRSAPGFDDIRWFDSIDSTNRYLLDEARAGAPHGVVAVADHQTAGRGRLGRSWEAPPGSNLLVSILLRVDLPAEDRHLASAAVALAAASAITAETGVAPGIKWPNDLLAADGRKLAGVLAEADLAGPPEHGSPPIVVGIGINVGWPLSDDDLPDGLVGEATSLEQEAGRAVDRSALLFRLLEDLGPRLTGLGSSEGRAKVASDLRGTCVTLGRRVRVQLPDGQIEGTATDLTDEGHLVVATDDGSKTVVAGDVVHVRAAG